MKVALIGFGVEGEGALKYWSKLGADITICDQDPDKQIPQGTATQLGANYLEKLAKFDIIWRTAGINPDTILAANPSVKEKITTTIDEFLRVCPTKHVIGVTGTKGKGTTSTLTAKMLEAAGKKVFLGGNIGISPFDFLDDITDSSWVVLEISSFQSIDLTRSPAMAVCLMVVPEHLNWHRDAEDYYNAKAQLFAYQQPSDIAIYFADNENSEKIAGRSPGHKIPYCAVPGAHLENNSIVIDGIEIVRTNELTLLGAHNWQNVCAAVTAVWQVTKDVDALQKTLTTFSGLEHRLELVRELNGVKYYDDSFGTTPETAIVAIQAFDQPKVLILGGSDKGTSFDNLAKIVAASNIRQAIIIGNTQHASYVSAGPAIESALKAAGVSALTSLIKPGGTTMEEIVRCAHDAAKPGDVVLLSTATASFDMFENYKDRGNQFKAAVNKL